MLGSALETGSMTTHSQRPLEAPRTEHRVGTAFAFSLWPGRVCMIDTGHLKLDPRAAVRTVVRCFRVPLSLPETLHAFSQSMKLATSRLGEQKPQQHQDDKVMDELYVEEKHRGLCSF
jgi:hypothetical protein